MMFSCDVKDGSCWWKLNWKIVAQSRHPEISGDGQERNPARRWRASTNRLGPQSLDFHHWSQLCHLARRSTWTPRFLRVSAVMIIHREVPFFDLIRLVIIIKLFPK